MQQIVSWYLPFHGWCIQSEKYFLLKFKIGRRRKKKQAFTSETGVQNFKRKSNSKVYEAEW